MKLHLWSGLSSWSQCGHRERGFTPIRAWAVPVSTEGLTPSSFTDVEAPITAAVVAAVAVADRLKNRRRVIGSAMVVLP